MLEHLNLQLFEYFNAAAHPTLADRYFAIFMANDTLYILLFALITTWFLGGYHAKALVLKSVMTCASALIIAYFISVLYPQDRPFVLHLGHTLIPHAATASFPSNHMTIFSSIAMSFIFSRQYKWGSFLMLCACIVAWARVYVGVHFPFDMLGALGVALFTNIILLFIWRAYKAQMMQLALKIYSLLFSRWIKKGVIR